MHSTAALKSTAPSAMLAQNLAGVAPSTEAGYLVRPSGRPTRNEPSFSASQNLTGGKQPTTLTTYYKALVELSGGRLLVYVASRHCVAYSILVTPIY